VLVSECDELGGVQWQWHAADGMLGKARLGGEKTGRDPTDRGKNGTKKHILTGGGGPLGAVAAGANVPDCKPLGATIEAVVVERPYPEAVEQHLCLNAGFDDPSGRAAVEKGGYVGHIRPSRPGKREKRRPGRRKARRWAVERTLGWLSKCRGILVRYEKKDINYLGLIQLARGLYWFRRLHRTGECDATANTT
jgi:putative transposase